MKSVQRRLSDQGVKVHELDEVLKAGSNWLQLPRKVFGVGLEADDLLKIHPWKYTWPASLTMEIPSVRASSMHA